MKLLFISLAFGFSFLLLNSCHERGPLFPPPALGLGLRDFSCTEAWIEVQVGNNDKTANIYIKKNDEIIKTITLGQSDSLFYFDNLQPNTGYKFDAVTYDDGKEIKSNPVTFTTLDTTSHNFSWQTFEFGQHSSSVLYDVAIINENNIWAVGEIYMNDSLGNPDPNAYNAVHWNGQSWELKRLFYKGGIWTITTIFDFNENDIWFSGYMRYLNGNFIELPIPDVLIGWQINKLWGSSSNDLYAVGNNGNIAHYNGSSWTKIESGTTTDIQDVLGFKDAFTSETSVYCAVSYVFQNGDRKILQIKSNTVDSLNWMGDKRINSIWTSNNKFFFTAGDGVFENK
ncbi:MAG: glucosyl transferase, partial [Ignavibacterium sp.]|nr:glucosyl transferase [Ignavibacterium sp.]